MTYLKPFALAVLLALAGGCTVISPSVETYSTLPAEGPPQPLQILPARGMDGGSLAFQQHATELAGLLAAKGYTPSGRTAPLIARYGYETLPPVERVTTRREPVYAVRHVRRSNGKVSVTRYVSHWHTVEERRTVYPRTLRLDITERASGQKVYEGTATSENVCKSSSNVIRLMTEAMLRDFPAPHRGSVTVSNDTAC
ncbi:DUF4136 domain-containing protein [Ferrimonas balearica]|nr:DUF4136 domain-containing protein [Ferrimonas balearica]